MISYDPQGSPGNPNSNDRFKFDEAGARKAIEDHKQRSQGGDTSGSIATSARVEGMVGNYKLTPATLYNRIDPAWIAKDFLLFASLKIAQTVVKPNGRLIISWPPRHGKSRLATIATPIWIMENFPQLNIILATYGADLSTDFGREVRDIFTKNTGLLNERIRPDVKSVGKFMTTKGGGMLNVGLGGGITGKGANVFLIDDYIKEMKEALSPTKRNSDWEWFTGTAYHRLEPDASMIIIATRWHRDDLIGRILRNFPGEWDIINFPAIAEENDVLGRPVGQPLFPERYDYANLMNKKMVLGTTFFNAIFQQDPAKDNASLTDRNWIEVVDEVPTHPRMRFARIWDFAGTKGGGDYTCGGLLGFDMMTRITYLMDMYRKQVSPQTSETAARSRAKMDGSETRIYIEQEPGASGLQLVSHYENNVLPEFKVKGSPNTTSKMVRAQPMLAAAEAGKFKMLRGSWNEAFLTEFEEFPDGDHDDQIDVCAIGYNATLGHKNLAPTWGRTPDTQAKGPPKRTNPGEVQKRRTSVVW